MKTAWGYALAFALGVAACVVVVGFVSNSITESHVKSCELMGQFRHEDKVVTGYAIEKPVEGGQPERGFITAGGFVGWWR